MNQQQQTTEFVEETADQSYAQSPKKAKTWDKIVNVLLVVVIVTLLATVLYKSFFVTNVVVSGDSMLPTYTSGTVVKVDRTANQNTISRGDVVVFYLNHPGWLKEHFDFFSKGKQDADNQYRLLIKRVIATQGDQIWVERISETDQYVVKIKTADGNVVSELYTDPNGDTIEEATFYVPASQLKRLEQYTQVTPYVVPQGYFFAMGDNRSNSHDSRYADMGDIPYSNVFGKVF